MIVKVGTRGEVTLADLHDVRHLSCRTHLDAAGTDAALRAAGAGWCVSGDHVWLNQNWLHGLSTEPQWAPSVAGMVEVAQRHGWWNEAARAVRAHIGTD